MAIRRIQNQSPSALQAEQKIAFALLVFLGFGGIIFGFRSFGANLYRPIQQQFAKYYTGEDVVNLNAKDSAEVEEQKKKDTDGDGVSDYDELYVYKTSPYLKDSDSDSVEDKTEIFAGTDPNCPAGKDCEGVAVAQTAPQTNPDEIVGGLVGTSGQTDAIIQSGKMQFHSQAEAEAFFKAATSEEIRAALIQAGANKDTVNKLTDTELQKIYNDAIAKASASGSLDSLVTGNVPTQTGASAGTTTKQP